MIATSEIHVANRERENIKGWPFTQYAPMVKYCIGYEECLPKL